MEPLVPISKIIALEEENLAREKDVVHAVEVVNLVSEESVAHTAESLLPGRMWPMPL